MPEAQPANRPATIGDGIRAGLPFGAAALLLGLSFGVVARPVMGGEAAIAMSAFVFAGAVLLRANLIVSLLRLCTLRPMSWAKARNLLKASATSRSVPVRRH